MSNQGRKFIELLDKRESLKGTKVARLLLGLSCSRYAVNRNYVELFAAIQKFEKDMSIWEVDKRNQLDSFLTEFLRLLQNYLSSIYSLIQHAKIFCDELESQELNTDYANRLGTLLGNNCVRFVRDLRTYSQHIALPIVAANISYTRINEATGEGKIEQSILLEKKELMKWKRWHKDSLNYINSQKQINLKVPLNEYQILIRAFYDWFYKKVTDLYSEELRELAELESELAKLG